MYFTTLNETKTILCFELHRVSSILSNNGGINIQNANIVDLKEKPYTKADIIVVHLFQIFEHFATNFDYTLPFPKDIECDSIIIDTMGEYRPQPILEELIQKFESEFNIKSNHKKIVGIFEDTDPIKVKNWDIFKYELSSLFFIGPHNDTFHRWNNTNYPKVFMGSKFIDSKQNVFQCLNNMMRPHRVVLIERMAKSKKIFQYGVISSKVGKYENHSSPLIKVDDVTEDGTETRFGLQTQFSNKCYIDVVTETSVDYQFITEKSLKPFMLLQFPIIFGYSGIIQYFRDKGFDMFDDIIDHSYDKLSNDNLTEKSDMIVSELERLCDLDWNTLNIDNKSRLKHNQYLLNKYNFESKRTEAIAEFIIGNNYTFNESDTYDKEYVS